MTVATTGYEDGSVDSLPAIADNKVMTEEILMTVEDAAKFLGIQVPSVRLAIRKGKLASIKAGQATLVRRRDAIDYRDDPDIRPGKPRERRTCQYCGKVFGAKKIKHHELYCKKNADRVDPEPCPVCGVLYHPTWIERHKLREHRV